MPDLFVNVCVLFLGEGDQRQKVKAFLESQGIDPSAMDTTKNANRQGGGADFISFCQNTRYMFKVNIITCTSVSNIT